MVEYKRAIAAAWAEYERAMAAAKVKYERAMAAAIQSVVGNPFRAE